MPTKADLKASVARQLGKTNAATPVPKRDLSIQDALMQYVGERAWTWNEATVSLSDGDALPADFSDDYDPKGHYYEGTRKVPLRLVADADLASWLSPAFSVDSGTFQTNATVAVTLKYQMAAPTIDAAGADDADVLPMSDITTVSRLAVALYWLAAERDDENFDRFTVLYNRDLLPRDILRDKRKTQETRPGNSRRNLGWNVNRSSSTVPDTNTW